MAYPLADGMLDRLRSQSAPREERLCAELARIMEPTGGFVLYAILWIFIGGFGIGFAPVLALILVVNAVAPAAAHASWFLATWLGLWLVCEIGAWWLFARLVRRRRARAAELPRDGVLVEVTPGAPEHGNRRGGTFTAYRIDFRAGGVAATTSLEAVGHVGPLEGSVAVLFKNGHRVCAVFSRNGLDLTRYAVTGS